MLSEVERHNGNRAVILFRAYFAAFDFGTLVDASFTSFAV